MVRMPAIGPITESAARLGLTPLNKSKGGKECPERMIETGGRFIRPVLTIGMTSRALTARDKPKKADIWTVKLLGDKPFGLATVAMANKSDRVNLPGNARRLM